MLATFINTTAMLLAAVALTANHPVTPQLESSSGAAFALIDSNEWCPGGSVYLDLSTGSFMLYRRSPRPACTDPKLELAVEHGILRAAALKQMRAAYAKARRAGLRRPKCDMIVSNGGREALVITAPNFSDTTPEELGCWSGEATALHDAFLDVFGEQRRLSQ
jgi:hypothetical protein